MCLSASRKCVWSRASYLVHIHIDEDTQRIVGSAKVERYLQQAKSSQYHRGQELEVIVQQKTPLGFKVIADNRCAGMIYDNQIFEAEPHAGEVRTATVVNVRPDGKLDLSLQRIGKNRFRDFATQLEEELINAGGELPYGDDSTPEEIMERFGVSKKTFKRAVGNLYKAQKLAISSRKIVLKS